MLKVHLDTDFGGDIDDLCALALLLRWPDPIQITGITTVAEVGGKRAGYVRYVLALEGRQEIPVAAGADNDHGHYPMYLGLPPEDRYWPEAVPPYPGSSDAAVDLLKNSIDQGALIIGIGPYTNLAMLEERYPGTLINARVFLMGGFIFPPRAGFPPWGNDFDFNLQIDHRSSLQVLQNSSPTFIPISVTVETALRRAHLPAISRAGALGELIARQAVAFAEDEQLGPKYCPSCSALPADFINFHHDPLACAVALIWEVGVEIKTLNCLVEENQGLISERIHPAGKPFRYVTQVDGPRFSQFWLDQIIQ
jgi:inosine-uridine nucleoside N-ribohydrolase